MATNSKNVPRHTAASKAKLGSVPPRRIASESSHPIDTAVDKFFQNDERLRAAMSRNLKKRSAVTIKASARAKVAFEGFSPSKYSTEERARRNFVSTGVSPAVATRAVVEKGVELIRASAPQRAMKVHLGGGLDKIIERSQGGASIGWIPLGKLMAYVQAKIESGALTPWTSPAFTECRAEAEAQRRLDQILGAGIDEGTTPTVATDTPDPADPQPQETGEFVSAQVRTQMESATSPEEELHFAVPSRSDPKQTDKAVETFELRAGPADVTSYHDFNNLQIAFEHVWQEIFDGRLSKLGQDLYREYVKLQEFVGKDPDDRTIDTIDDLRSLMDDIRELGRLSNDATPAQLQPKDESGSADSVGDTTDAVVDVVTSLLDPAGAITDAIGNETVAAIINPAGAIIKAIGDAIKGLPQLTWASFPGREPIDNGDIMTISVDPNAVAKGTVEIQLRAGEGVGWKGMNFIRIDEENRPLSPMGIVTANRDDPMVWNRDAYNRLPLYTHEVDRAYLEFWREGILSIHGPRYVMDGLAEKLTDGTRVTFTWTKG